MREETVKYAMCAVQIRDGGIFNEDFNTSASCVIVRFIVGRGLVPEKARSLLAVVKCDELSLLRTTCSTSTR